MARRVALIIAAVVLVFATVAWADDTFQGFQIVRVVLNGKEVVSDVPAVNFYGRTLVPVRKLAELTGLTVDRWDEQTSTVYVSGGGDQALATVNGEPITQTDLYNRMVAETGTKAMDDLITEKLVDQAARQAGVTVTAAEVDREIDAIKQRVGGETQFQAALEQNNLTLAQLQENQRIRLTVVKLLTPTISVNDDLLQKYFADNKAQFDTRQVHARHILVATEEEAKAIKAQLDQGADFATLAKAKSIDPSAKQNGGDLGFFGPGRMVPEFEQVVFALKPGEVSQPFKSQFGWHVAQTLEVTGTAPDFAAQKADVQQAYVSSQVQARIQPWLADLRAKAQITNTLLKTK